MLGRIKTIINMAKEALKRIKTKSAQEDLKKEIRKRLDEMGVNDDTTR
jgi:hypothetical protein